MLNYPSEPHEAWNRERTGLDNFYAQDAIKAWNTAQRLQALAHAGLLTKLKLKQTSVKKARVVGGTREAAGPGTGSAVGRKVLKYKKLDFNLGCCYGKKSLTFSRIYSSIGLREFMTLFFSRALLCSSSTQHFKIAALPWTPNLQPTTLFLGALGLKTIQIPILRKRRNFLRLLLYHKKYFSVSDKERRNG